MKKSINELALELHKKLRGKMEVCPKMQIKDKKDLSLIYTPGVAAVSTYVANHKSEQTIILCVVTSLQCIGWLGSIGPRKYRSEGALPVMEGKCVVQTFCRY